MDHLSMKPLIDILNQVLDEAGRDQRQSLNREIHLQKDLQLDSLELAVLTVRIEAEYGVDVFRDGIVSTIGEIQDKLDGG